MDWIIGLALMAYYVMGPLFSIGIFLFIGYFVLKALGGIFGNGYDGGYGGSSGGAGSFPSSTENFSRAMRELNERNRIRSEQSDLFKADLQSKTGISLDD